MFGLTEKTARSYMVFYILCVALLYVMMLLGNATN